MSTRPNIVLIVADDMGYSDLGCYGGEIATPNLDRLASNGLRFSQFYNNAICCATRASLLTGLYSQQVDRERSPGCVTIAELLKTAGYHTLMTGKWHLQDQLSEIPCERGFDRNYGPRRWRLQFLQPRGATGRRAGAGEEDPGTRLRGFRHRRRSHQAVHARGQDYYTTDAFTDRALGYLDEYGRDENPFFLYMAYTAPHFPLQARPRDIAKYQGKYKVGWDTLREQRMERMLEMGLIEDRWALSAHDPDSLPWEEIEDKGCLGPEDGSLRGHGRQP